MVDKCALGEACATFNIQYSSHILNFSSQAAYHRTLGIFVQEKGLGYPKNSCFLIFLISQMLLISFEINTA